MIKSFAHLELYKNTYISIESNYFSPLSIRRQGEVLSKYLDKSVVYNLEGKVKAETGSDYVKIYPNNFDGLSMITIETGYMPYFEAINIISKILVFINEKGYTRDKCTFKVKIKIDSAAGYGDIRRLNTLKYVLGLDESLFFKKWKKNGRRINKYLTDFIVPKELTYSFDFKNIDPRHFDIPTSKYFGLDFTTIKNGFFSMNYIGGSNYEQFNKEIVDGIRLIVDRAGVTLQDPNKYTAIELATLRKSVLKHMGDVMAIRSLKSFQKTYPAIQLFIDLKDKQESLKLKYPTFKKLLFKLIVHGNLKKGLINYDTERDIFQMKDANIFYIINISDLEIYDSIVSGDFKNCLFRDCKIRNSRILDSRFDDYNKVSNSHIYKTSVYGKENKIANSFIYDCGVVKADVRACVLQNSYVPYGYKMDANTRIINT